MSRSTAQLVSYAGLVFVTSALVLMVEVVAARLIAPFVGVSLYSWTAIIGVVLARALYDRDPAAHIVVAEIDPAVTKLAEDQLYVDTTPFEVRHTDARVALQADPLKYDVIVGDVFHDIAIPYHLITAEFARLVKQRLKPAGIYLMNVVDTYPNPRLVKAKIKTLATEFDDVQVWMDGPPKGQARVTYVISARNTGPELPFIYESQRGLNRLWGQATKGLQKQGTPMAEIPLITDDLAPVERLMAGLFLGDSGR